MTYSSSGQDALVLEDLETTHVGSLASRFESEGNRDHIRRLVEGAVDHNQTLKRGPDDGVTYKE